MGRSVGTGLVALLLLAACSGGSGSAAKATTTTSTTTSTTAPTTSTTTPEEAVKQAWDQYWAMVVRLLKDPNADDPELTTRAADPVLSSLRDDLATRKQQGKRLTIPEGARYDHRLDHVTVQSNTASATGCKFDDSVLVGPNGETLDNSVTTSKITATLVLDGTAWKMADVHFVDTTPGISECAD
jgi:acetyl esterase/lipase